MIQTTNVNNLSERINTLLFAKYLKDSGWNHFDTKRKDIRVFQKTTSDGKFHQVIIPLERSLPDYDQAIMTAVDTVATAEGGTKENLLMFLLNPNSDILKIRLCKKGIESGSILFEDALHLYENARKLIASAAMDVQNPRKYHRGRTDTAVNDFLNSCRFGQTEIGSYVLSIVCPLGNIDEDGVYHKMSVFSTDCDDSFTRKVTCRVMDNLLRIKKCIDEGEYPRLTDDDDPISANFYEALAGLNLDCDDTSVEVSVGWTPSVKNDRCTTDSISFSHDYYQPIMEAIDRIKRLIDEKTRIIGRINKLESIPDVEKRISGKVSVVYIDDVGKRRTVRAELDRNDYALALEAHSKGFYVEIAGTLINAGKSNASISCESFCILE